MSDGSSIGGQKGGRSRERGGGRDEGNGRGDAGRGGRQGRPLVVGLTGNIGSGKSTVAQLLAQHGAVVIDSDALARSATEDPEVLERIAAELGEDLVQGGRLDRQLTGERVFADDRARQTLEGIIHPWVRSRSSARQRQALEQDPPPPLVVHDIPLLFENELEDRFDRVVVVSAPLETRAARARERSGISREEFLARDAVQVPLAEKAARAHHVIENSGDMQSLREQVEGLWRLLVG